ncbi:hypothetical protein [Arsenicibacter rosenii]|uniref:Uncharacterized protein n=1 Tax=Arsenicibacter rosenii TaxID=1750698 RepID=A0A1S2VGH3_9BACT|nr:hypothetical protein [Arsenicibacter rosenii]OIN57365.1 hypothetical protein BLX24_20535 [Arsenicibacter rosenii]
MKKAILTIATLALLTTGTVLAQRGYDPNYDNRNRYPNQGMQNPRADDARDEYRIDRLDAIVGLTRRQERELRRIENHYDRLGLMPGNRLDPREFQRLSWQKQHDVMDVLTPAQRDRLYTYQHSNRYNRGYDRGYDRDRGYGYPDRGGYGGRGK